MKQENGFPIWISLSALQIFIIFLSKICLRRLVQKMVLSMKLPVRISQEWLLTVQALLLLTREEIDLITHYRNADADERKLTQKVLGF